MEDKVIDIQELAQDRHNFNRGNEEGQQLMERSFKELGAGRSILLDKNGNIIAGNKSQKAAIAAGIKRVRVVETTGDELVAVKRTDVDIDSADGRKMAYLDNLTTQVNLTWDQTELEAVQADVEGFDIADFGIDIEGLPQVTFPTGEKQGDGEDEKHGGSSASPTENYNVVYSLVFNDEAEQETWFQFLRKLKARYPDKETISARVVEYITNSEIWQE
jgi:hypothetical protein